MTSLRTSDCYAPALAICLFATACGVGPGDDGGGTGIERTDSALVDGTPEGVGVLRLLNDPETTLVVLDVDASMNRRAAQALMAHRAGPDGRFGTRDDDRFDSIAEVDSVRYVGPTALGRLVAFAHASARVPEGDELLGSYDRVRFSVDEAAAALRLINRASVQTLDVDMELNRRAVDSIVAARPIASMQELSELRYVGATALRRIKAYPPPRAGAGRERELGIISDLDKTVIPPQADDLPDPPYPGVASLYRALELRNGGRLGDLHFVTARDEEGVQEVPEWLAAHGVPSGPIFTGHTGQPWAARQEKIADITKILDANPGQSFVFFGDSSHVDPEVYQHVAAAYPDRIVAVFIHKVTRTIRADRVDGPAFHLIEDYAQAAAKLLSLSVLDVATTRAVLEAAQFEGLALTDAQIDQLIAGSALQ